MPNVITNLILQYDDCFIGSQQVLLSGPIDSMSCMAGLPNGNIVCCSDIRRNFNYDEVPSEQIITIIPPEDNRKQGIYDMIPLSNVPDITCMGVISNVKIVIGSSDGNLRIINLETKNIEHILTGHDSRILCIAIFDDIVSGSMDNTIRIWDKNIGICKHILQGHKSRITSLDIFLDGKIVSGSFDGQIYIWDTKN